MSRSLFIYEHVSVHAGATRGESLLLLCVRTQPILNAHTRTYTYAVTRTCADGGFLPQLSSLPTIAPFDDCHDAQPTPRL